MMAHREVSDSVQSTDRVVLVCDGLDTVSSVFVNDKLVGQSDNMFVRYMFDVKPALKTGVNVLRIEFESAVHYAGQKADSSEYKILPSCPPPDLHGECHGNMIRKTQCSFGWDMAPALVTAGIWRNIYILASDSVELTDVTAGTKQDGGLWILSVGVHTVVHTKQPFHSTVTVTIEGTTVSTKKTVAFSLENQSTDIEMKIPKTVKIEEWWPHGYGKQKLYNVTVKIIDKLDVILSEKTVRFGFRTVELVQETVSDNNRLGQTFYFKINGHAIFLKGSNWVPADSFPERVTKQRLRNYLQSAVDVHMNCIRVWGGGNYEQDYFYDLADELGILIWQDFMFSASLYPVDERFINSVKQEVRYQVRRLKRHPSVFCYAGNNEVEMGITGGWWGPRSTRYEADYVKLFILTIHDVLREEDTEIPYLPSSPSDGIQTIMKGGISYPANTLYGDNHIYIYEKEFFTDYSYKTPRFASEYGFQSYPSLESLKSVYADQDMFYESQINEHRQHHHKGNTQMLDLIRMYMKLPSSNNTRKVFEDILYCTQIVQSIAVRTETEHFRRWQSDIGRYGEGRTMGALYWMLADIWPSASWSSIEYGGKWKMLHYYAQHFFEPILISPYINFDKLSVYIVVDNKMEFNTEGDGDSSMWPFNASLLSRLKNYLLSTAGGTVERPLLTGTLYIRVYSYSSLLPKFVEQIHFQTHNASELVYEIRLSDFLTRAGCATANQCFVVCYLGDIQDGSVAWYPLGQFDDVSHLKTPNLKITSVDVSSEDNNVFEIVLHTEAVAPFVWLEADGIHGRFSDNGFLMYTQTKTILFYAWEDVDRQTLTDSLKVKSLLDIYS